jgi:lipoprotein-releasing system ATP-binding protein
MPLIEATNVFKTYRMGRVRVPVLRGAGMSVERGECIAVLGASGSGKSTLMHLLGGLDRPDSGTPGTDVRFDGASLSAMSAGELDAYRSSRVGFVFQFYHLLPELSVLQNVVIASMVRWGRMGYMRRAGDIRGHAEHLLGRFGLGHRLRHRPVELSGGERQRVAIARALINEPDVLLADEPTGNLDQSTGASILDAIMDLRRERALTIVLVTHDPSTAARADRTVRLRDGVVVSDAAPAIMPA